MARKRVRLSRDVQAIVASASAALAQLSSSPATTKSELNERIDAFIGLGRDSRELALHQLSKMLPQKSAIARILAYLRLNVGTPVPGEVLQVVSAIGEFPRRIRELRDEHGWPIAHDEAKDTYTLERDEQDAESAEKWRTLNGIRRQKKAAIDRMLDLFLAYPGEVVTTAQLRYVTVNKDMRRVRELRTERGYRIMTRNTGRPDLGQSEYLLADVEPVEPHDRHISDSTIAKVLDRDQSKCQKKSCGWNPADRQPGDPRQYIEVHHVKWHSEKGGNTPENLITLCNVHHREVHSKKLKGTTFSKWLDE